MTTKDDRNLPLWVKPTTHAELVDALTKSGAQLMDEQSPSYRHLNHMCLGLAGEVGELVDAIKRKTIYRKELDLARVIEELGGIEFYLEGIRVELGIARDTAIKAGIAKFNLWYPVGGYSGNKADKE